MVSPIILSHVEGIILTYHGEPVEPPVEQAIPTPLSVIPNRREESKIHRRQPVCPWTRRRKLPPTTIKRPWNRNTALPIRAGSFAQETTPSLPTSSVIVGLHRKFLVYRRIYCPIFCNLSNKPTLFLDLALK